MQKTVRTLIAAILISALTLALALNNADLHPSIDEGASSVTTVTLEQQLQSELEALGIAVV